MKHFIYLLAATSVLFASCNKPFKKSEGGMQYKIISEGSGKTLQSGNFFEIQVDQVYQGSGKDSVLYDSRELANQIFNMDSNAIPGPYYKIFQQARKGDSIIIKQLTDSLMKGGNTPPFMRKGAYIVAHYKIVNIFQTKEGADSAYKAQMEVARVKDSVKSIAQTTTDDKIITDYLAKNNIKATKAPLGTYVEILSPGAGPLIDTSVSVQVLYRGKNMQGGEFDTNMDTSNGRPAQPILVTMSGDPSRGMTVIKGWNDGLSLLNKGAKARFFIPSPLGYGSQAQGPQLKANEILIFDIVVADVLDRTQAVAANAAMQKMMMAQREAMMQAQQQAQQAQGQGQPQGQAEAPQK
ncbi:MAG: FKBP-type peptidyl-prolyl cis-trans isomerase [Bacteroidota bacterium]